MKGTVLAFNEETREGVISAENQERYTLLVENWKGNDLPRAGVTVDFVISEDNVAKDIYPAVDKSVAQTAVHNQNRPSGKKISAALLAFFLGVFGVHKFYLGYTGAGIVMLLMGTIGWLLILPPVIAGVIAFIEFIIYLTKTDEDFDEIYVHNRRSWF